VSDRSRLRLVVLRALVVSLLLTLLGRLWYLQVLAGPEYARAAADNQKRDIITTAPRGEIVDDRGRAFARNKTALVVSVDRVAMQRQGDCIVITNCAARARCRRAAGTVRPMNRCRSAS
jgi:penicillin-binding protein 2